MKSSSSCEGNRFSFKSFIIKRTLGYVFSFSLSPSRSPSAFTISLNLFVLSPLVIFSSFMSEMKIVAMVIISDFRGLRRDRFGILCLILVQDFLFVLLWGLSIYMLLFL